MELKILKSWTSTEVGGSSLIPFIWLKKNLLVACYRKGSIGIGKDAGEAITNCLEVIK